MYEVDTNQHAFDFTLTYTYCFCCVSIDLICFLWVCLEQECLTIVGFREDEIAWTIMFKLKEAEEDSLENNSMY